MALGTRLNFSLKMADNNPSSSKSTNKERGPYNQYLSQPQAKVPRTTLKRWPRNASTSLFDINQTVRLNEPSALHEKHLQCENCVYDVDNVCPLENVVECYMSDIRSLEAYLGEASASLLEESPNESADFAGLDPEFVVFDRISAESENDATAHTVEDEEDDTEHYMDDFNVDECTVESNEEATTEDAYNADVPLYFGAPISVAVSMLLIITFAIRHCLTGVALVDLLTLVSLLQICGEISALGVMSPELLSAALRGVIESKLGTQISQTFTFKRIQVNRNIIHSKSYLNVSRRNSCTIEIDNLGLHCVEAKFFVKVLIKCPNAIFCSSTCRCKVPYYYGITDFCYQPATDVTISHDIFTNCNPKHVIPVGRKQCYNLAFPITAIKDLYILIDCQHNDNCMFICKVPNRWERD